MILIAGPCVIESEELCFEIVESLIEQLKGLPVELYFKASFDKANRSSIKSHRGVGIDKGLQILKNVKEKYNIKTLTDFHLPEQADTVAQVVDFLQIPAFLCRQTDMIISGTTAAIKYGKKLNIKKGQFLAPWDVKNILDKVKEIEEMNSFTSKSPWFWITERGVSFGYNTYVVDMISFQAIQSLGGHVLYDATHSVQKPGAGVGGKQAGGQRVYLETLARAAVAAGAEGIFMECHPCPDQSQSDPATSFQLESVGEFVSQLCKIKECVKPMKKLLKEAREG